MKNFKKLFLLFAIGTFALASCSKTTDTTGASNPSINVTPSSDITLAQGAQASFGITANENTSTTSPLTNLEIKITYTGGASVLDTNIAINKLANYGYTYNWNVPMSATNGSTYTVSFTVTDNKSYTATTTRNINVKGGSVTNQSGTLGAQMNTLGSFYASANGSVFTASQAKSNQSAIDFVYYYDATTNATIAAPADATAQSTLPSYFSGWSTFNNTTMKKTATSSVDITTLTYSNIAAAYSNASGSESTNVSNLAVGDVVMFKTAAGKYGAFKVSSLNSGNVSTGSITIASVVQL